MARIISLFASAAVSLTLLGATVQPASAANVSYRAVPAIALAKADTVVVGEVMWKCAPGGCTASNATARPAIVCAQAARKVGKLDSFAVGGQSFGAEELAKCNVKAKGGSATALARN